MLESGILPSELDKQDYFELLKIQSEMCIRDRRNSNGTDTQWEYLRPSQVAPFLLEDGSGLVYNVTFDGPEIGYRQALSLIHIL